MTIVYNLSTGSSQEILSLVKPCDFEGNTVLVTPSHEFFCFVQGNGTQDSFNLLQFDPTDYSPMHMYTYKFKGFQTDYFQTGNYLSYITQDPHAQGWNATTLNTSSGQYSCNVSIQNEEYQIFNNFFGSGYIYQDPKFAKNIQVVFCTSDNFIETPIPTLNGLLDGIMDFNHSTVFIVSLSKTNGVEYYFQPFLLDITGTLRFGEVFNMSVGKFNDTHFVGAYRKGGFSMYGVFTLTPDLKLYQTATLNTSINASDPGIEYSSSLVPGEECIIYNQLSIYSGYSYNFDLGEYTGSFPDVSPILLGNGSSLHLTDYGYFIQSPGEPMYFIGIPFLSIYQDPDDNNTIWTFYIPNNESVCRYGQAVLLEIEISSSTITEYVFESYPYLASYGDVLDVEFDKNGDLNILYALEGLYLLGQTGYKKIFEFKGVTNIDGKINYTSGVGTFVLYDIQFNITNFYISNSSAINSSIVGSIQGKYVRNYVQILGENYFLLSSSNTTSSNHTVWNAIEQNEYQSFVVDASFIVVTVHFEQVYINQFPMLAANNDISSQNIYGSILIGGPTGIKIVNNGDVVGENNVGGDYLINIVQLGTGNYWTLSQGVITSYWRSYAL